MPARTQIRQVFGVDTDKVETEFPVAEKKIEISSTQADMLLDVTLDACLYIGCHHGGRGSRCVQYAFPLFPPATRKHSANRRQYRHYRSPAHRRSPPLCHYATVKR
jgi:hypothetical protein